MPRKMTRRQFLAAGLASAGAAALVACGAPPTAAPATAPTNAPPAQPTNAPPAQPTTAPTAVAPTSAPPASANEITLYHPVGGTENQWYPIYGDWGNQSTYPAYLGHTRVIESGNNLSVHPGLASKWEVSPDATVFTFHLRNDVKFADGTPVTAADVEYTIRFLCGTDFGFEPADLAGIIKGYADFHSGKSQDLPGVKATDDSTVVFTLEKPWAGWNEWALVETNILPKHIFEKYQPSDFKEQFAPAWYKPDVNMGSGPFQIKNIVQDQSIEMVRNDQFYLGKPKLDRVWFKNFGGNDTQFIALQKGDLDIWNVPTDYLDKVKALPNVTVTQVDSTYFRRFYVNYKQPYLSDKRVRQALYYGINRQALCAQLQGGQCRPHNTFMTLSTWVPAGLNEYPYDPEKAKQLLKDAGWDSSKVLRLTYYYTDSLTKDLMAAVQADLGKVGVQIQPQQIEGAVDNAIAKSCDFDLRYSGDETAYPTTFDFAAGTGCEQIWPDPDITALMNKARATVDDQARHALYDDIQRRFNDFLPELILYKYVKQIAVNKRVQNFGPDDYWWMQTPNMAGGWNNAHLWSVAT